MDNRCVKCGAKIGEGVGNKKRLWCSVCLDEVNKELTGQQDKPYQYYFKHHLKQMKKERDLFGQEGEFGCGKTLNRMPRGSK